MKRAGTRRPTTRATLTARLDRCALIARHALCVGSVLIFVAAFGGLAPVYVPALSTPALIAFALWCALVLALMLTTAARVTARLVLGATRAARSVWGAPASDPR